MQQRSLPVHRRLIKAFGYSCAGLAAALRHEAAFRYEAVVSLVVVPLGLWLGRSGGERALLVASWLAVPVVELLNSALEAVVDRIGPERHELAGRAKDMGSAAVLLAIVTAVGVWVLILADRL
jgi:diacylglycerol kinase (ATP)